MKKMFSEQVSEVQTTGEQAIQMAGDNATQKAGWYSTQAAGAGSTQTAGADSTQTAGYGSTQKAGAGSTQTAGLESTQKACAESTQTACNDSTQKAGDRSTQTAGLNSVQIIHWIDNKNKVRVSTRIITEKEADKPYKFYDGDWHLIEPEIKPKPVCENKVIEVDVLTNNKTTIPDNNINNFRDVFNSYNLTIKQLENRLNEELKTIEKFKKDIAKTMTTFCNYRYNSYDGWESDCQKNIENPTNTFCVKCGKLRKNV